MRGDYREGSSVGLRQGLPGLFPVTGANVSYDHPSQAPLEYSLNIDFVNEALGPGARIAVELSAESARALVQAVQAALETGRQQYQL